MIESTDSEARQARSGFGLSMVHETAGGWTGTFHSTITELVSFVIDQGAAEVLPVLIYFTRAGNTWRVEGNVTAAVEQSHILLSTGHSVFLDEIVSFHI